MIGNIIAISQQNIKRMLAYSTIANIDAQVKRLSSVEETQSIDTTEAEKELNTQNENLKGLSKTSSGQTTMKAYIDAIFELLKDTGIKTKVIRQYLPVMNKNCPA